MEQQEPVLRAYFYKTESGREPVREWLLSLDKEDKQSVGRDIKTAQFGWPLGMPLIRKIEKDLWEVRSHLKDGIGRVFFTVDDRLMVLLSGFIKKSQSTPLDELESARTRRKNYYAK